MRVVYDQFSPFVEVKFSGPRGPRGAEREAVTAHLLQSL